MRTDFFFRLLHHPAPIVAHGLAVSAESVNRFDVRSIARSDKSYFSYLFPAILAMSLLQVALFGTAAPIISAKEMGIYRFYHIVPVPRLALLGAQISVRLVISLLQVVLLVGVGCIAFEAPLMHPVSFLLVLVVAAVTLISYGYALAGLLSRMGIASAVLMLFNFHCMVFGQMFNDFSESSWKWLLFTTPVAFVSEALRLTITGQTAMFTLTEAIAGMTAYLVLTAFVGIRFFSFQAKAQ